MKKTTFTVTSDGRRAVRVQGPEADEDLPAEDDLSNTIKRRTK